MLTSQFLEARVEPIEVICFVGLHLLKGGLEVGLERRLEFLFLLLQLLLN